MATAEATRSGTSAQPGADGLRCTVVTPERTVLDESAEFVAVPLFDGELGILPGRAPLIGRLGAGELRTTSGGVTRRYFVDGGFVQVRDNLVTILTSRAMPARELNVTRAEADLAAARALPATTDAQALEKERAIARARAQIRVAERGDAA
jgi:F-type H+-transporting ATPase subunit epsilon